MVATLRFVATNCVARTPTPDERTHLRLPSAAIRENDDGKAGWKIPAVYDPTGAGGLSRGPSKYRLFLWDCYAAPFWHRSSTGPDRTAVLGPLPVHVGNCRVARVDVEHVHASKRKREREWAGITSPIHPVKEHQFALAKIIAKLMMSSIGPSATHDPQPSYLDGLAPAERFPEGFPLCTTIVRSRAGACLLNAYAREYGVDFGTALSKRKSRTLSVQEPRRHDARSSRWWRFRFRRCHAPDNFSWFDPATYRSFHLPS